MVRILSPENRETYRIMLVADGEPKHGGLSPMSYGREVRSVLHGFYSRERERIIKEASQNARSCGSRTPTYLMTTGFGAMPITSAIKLYNVPGEESIYRQEYIDKYRASFLDILASLPATIKQIVIVYYAGKTKQAFREGIFQILHELPRNYEIHAGMYGDKFHLAGQWRILCELFNALSTRDDDSLEEIKRTWMSQEGKIAAFFKWF